MEVSNLETINQFEYIQEHFLMLRLTFTQVDSCPKPETTPKTPEKSTTPASTKTPEKPKVDSPAKVTQSPAKPQESKPANVKKDVAENGEQVQFFYIIKVLLMMYIFAEYFMSFFKT